MASRYDDAYKDYQGIGVVKGPSKKERQGAKSASERADWMRMLGGIAPMAGTAIGAMVGGPAGAAIGGGIGQGVGGLANFGADSQTKKYEDAQMARQAKIDALLGAMGNRH